MKQVHAAVVSILLLCCCLLSQAQQSVTPDNNAGPRLLKFDGTLTDVSGRPLSGVVGVTTLLYEDERGGAPVWSETQDVQADATGHYTMLLGFATPHGVPRGLFNWADVYWIGTQISGQEESARVPYALNGAFAGTNSADWAGYVVKGSKFSLATGSWEVPKLNCTKTPNDYSVFWVGIDGYANSTVEQVGTTANCGGTAGTTPQYYAWYEFYLPPGVPRVVIQSVPVKPGDEIAAYVNYTDDANGPYWTVWIKNWTTGKTYSKQVPYNSQQKRAFAEWIAERPCCNSAGYDEPLADFGTANFGGYLTAVPGTNWATDSSTQGYISEFGSNVIKLTMEYPTTGGTVLATPSALQGMGGSVGSSFTVTWKAAGP